MVNAMDLAFFNTTCINMCTAGSHQYFCLIMVVFGLLGIIICVLYVLIIEFSILKEARQLDAYLENS